MNHTPDTAATDGGGAAFSAQQAADLLERTSQEAHRKLEPSPPWLLVTRAVMVLAALGAIWLTVRGQHPYKGPTAEDIPILVAFVVINFAATVTVRERALAGVRGPSRLRPAEIAIMVAAWVAVVVVIVALAAARLDYAKYPTTVLIIPGVAWAAVTAARKNWRGCATGTAVVVIGVAGLFAGPARSWAVAGVGLCALFLVRTGIIVWQRRA